MTQLRTSVCPVCRVEVSVTYWPFKLALFTLHMVRGSNRECRNSLRPVDPRTDGEAPPRSPPA
jgi:hypothetical protein